MLTFEDFHSDGICSAFICADNESGERTKFKVGSNVLIEVLSIPNPVHDDLIVNFCKKSRQRIEEACKRAFTERAAMHIELLPADFV